VEVKKCLRKKNGKKKRKKNGKKRNGKLSG
jgi:hypothetical protein